MLNKISHSLVTTQKPAPAAKPKAAVVAEKVDGVAKEILEALTGADKASVVVAKPNYTAMPEPSSVAEEIKDFIAAQDL